jgi:hypothetical protein
VTKVLRFDEITDLCAADGEELTELWAEIDETGWVVREIGFGADGSIRHKHPGDGPVGGYGLFDVTPLDPSTPADMSLETFDEMWKQPRIPWESEGDPSRPFATSEDNPGLFARFVDWWSRRGDPHPE